MFKVPDERLNVGGVVPPGVPTSGVMVPLSSAALEKVAAPPLRLNVPHSNVPPLMLKLPPGPTSMEGTLNVPADRRYVCPAAALLSCSCVKETLPPPWANVPNVNVPPV